MKKILVLAYHRVFPGYHIDPEIFEWQIKTLKEKFNPLTLDEVLSFIKGDLLLKKNGFVVTFDDGWADNFIYAYPILKKYNVPATIFVSTAFIQDKRSIIFDYAKTKEMAEIIKNYQEKYQGEFLSWEEINQMKPLIQIESHGHSHLNYANTPPEKIKEDIEKSIEIITEKIGRQPKFIAWPFGKYSKEAIKIAKETNLKAALTVKIGSVKTNSPLYELKRFSPPRHRFLFLIASKREMGMLFYRVIVFIFSKIKKFIKR
jgi:peptidoglycan/xylan/chitin deacetylase (PgdA/CDA1 family)